VTVDPKYHRHLVGRKGATIDKIKAESGAQITIPQSDSNSNIVRIEGVPEAVRTAKAAIEAVVTQLVNSKNIDMIIDRKFHSSLIGPKGATIADIIAKFNGITIQMPDPDADSEIVTVRGDRKDVDAAEIYIKKLLRTLEEEKYQIEVCGVCVFSNCYVCRPFAFPDIPSSVLHKTS
jgi:polyribonucleotide nucleotidyltransferase